MNGCMPQDYMVFIISFVAIGFMAVLFLYALFLIIDSLYGWISVPCDIKSGSYNYEIAGIKRRGTNYSVSSEIAFHDGEIEEISEGAANLCHVKSSNPSRSRLHNRLTKKANFFGALFGVFLLSVSTRLFIQECFSGRHDTMLYLVITGGLVGLGYIAMIRSAKKSTVVD